MLYFQPPERHPGWRRTLFAHRLRPRCPCYGNDTDVSEDCLYLNIWTPRVRNFIEFHLIADKISICNKYYILLFLGRKWRVNCYQ